MRRVLLVGGTGFLGKNLERALSERQDAAVKSIGIEDVDLTLRGSSSVLAVIAKEFNATDVVMLASNVGIDKFNDESSAFRCSIENMKMLQNSLEFLKDMNDSGHKVKNFIWFSTSEVFRNMTSFEDAEFKVTTSSCRSAYSQVKLLGETLFKSAVRNKIIDHLRIIRPFNISGRFQKRGVVYDMLKSAMNTGKIWYSADTTRSITSADKFTKTAVDAILSDSSKQFDEFNVYDLTMTMSMKTLAEFIASYVYDKFNKKVAIESSSQDSNIKSREAGSSDMSREMQQTEIYKILEQIET